MPGRKWLREEDSLLCRCIGLVSVEELAAQLNRTVDAVYFRIRTLHIGRNRARRPYGGEEIDTWADAQQSGESLRSIERRVGVSHATISRKIRERRKHLEQVQ